MTLKNTKTNLPQSMQIKKVRENFIFAHCGTCHSAQGSSIDGDITIFDYNHFDIRNYRNGGYGQRFKQGKIIYIYSDDVNDDFNCKCVIK